MSVKVKWFDREFDRLIVDPESAKLLNRAGAQGEAISKHLISGGAGLYLKAVDKGILLNSMTFEVDPRGLIVRIGTNIEYAPFVFLGTIYMPPRPILRVMLAILKAQLR